MQWQEEQAGADDFERVCSGMTSRRAAAGLGPRLPWLWHGDGQRLFCLRFFPLPTASQCPAPVEVGEGRGADDEK